MNIEYALGEEGKSEPLQAADGCVPWQGREGPASGDWETRRRGDGRTGMKTDQEQERDHDQALGRTDSGQDTERAKAGDGITGITGGRRWLRFLYLM